MGIVIRQGSKAAIISYIGAVMAYFNWLYFFPTWISTEKIGLLKAVFDISIAFIPFLQGGVASLIIKFAPYFQDNKGKEGKFLAYILFLPLILCLIFVSGFLIGREEIAGLYIENSPLLAEHIIIVMPIAIFAVYLVIVEALIRARMRIVIPKFVREVLVKALYLLAVYLHFLGTIDLAQLLISLVLISALHLLIIIIYYLWLRKKWVRPELSVVKAHYFKPLIDYSTFMFLGSGGGILVSKIDTIMTAALLGLQQTAIYGISFLIAQLIDLPRRTFTSILSPLVAIAYKNRDYKLLQKYYQRSAINLSIIGIYVFIALWSNLELIYSYIPNDSFRGGKWVMLYIGLAKVMDMSMGINNEIIQISKYYRWNIYITPAFAVIAIITNLIFIPIYGITGAAIATFFSVFGYNLIRFFLIKIKMGISPFKMANLKVVLTGSVCLLITEFIEIKSLWLDFAINILILHIVFIIPIFYMAVSEELNALIKKILKKIPYID